MPPNKRGPAIKPAKQVKALKPADLNIIAIGASAGGLEALQEFLSHLPEIKNAAIIVAQHLSPTHKSMLVQLLSRETKLQVAEAENGATLEANKIYITPPDKEISISANKIILRKPQSSVGPKPSVDVLFHSLAENAPHRVMGIILSGTGSDGASGVRMLKKNGGFIIAQEPHTAKYDGMPLAAIETGEVDLVLSPEKMGEEILEHFLNPGHIRIKQVEAENSGSSLEKIIKVLSKRTGTDFSNYKSATIIRRLEKRLAILKIKSIDSYLKLLEENPKEQDEMFNMILIGVTTFFRDMEAFGALENTLHKIVNAKTNKDPIRIWVPGCYTGEEAYSIAILLSRILKERTQNYNIQIFATDIDEKAIASARRGVYSAGSLENVPKEIIENYFVFDGNQYELVKSVRSMVLFSRHDLTNNPPFLKLDLISCRNLLIYFGASLQQQIIPIFHYALLQDAYLFLGKSETVGQYSDLFATVDGKYKIYQRKRGGNLHSIKFSAFKAQKQTLPQQSVKKVKKDLSISDLVKETIFNTYEHPYVVINDEFDILEINGDVRLFMTLTQGSVQVNLLKMINPELQIEIRSVITKAIKVRESVRSSIKKFELFGNSYYVRITTKPLIFTETTEELFIVIFERLDLEEFVSKGIVTDEKGLVDVRLQELEHELAATKEHLQTYIEELETSNEEMQSLNEEMQSTNEELQSSNEELETSNEELQSTNEEIQITYSELKAANQELERKENALKENDANINALLNNKLQAFVLIDSTYKVIKFNEKAEELFLELRSKKLKNNDSFIDLVEPGQLELFVRDFTKILKGETISREMKLTGYKGSDHWYSLNYTPVATVDRNVNGISIGILDITDLKIALTNLNEKEKMLSSVYNATSIGLCVTDDTGVFVEVNQSYCGIYGYQADELIGNNFAMMVPEPYRKATQELHDQFIITGVEMPGEWQVVKKDGTIIQVFATAELLELPNGKRLKITSVRDITAQKNSEELINANQLKYKALIDNSLSAILLTRPDGRILEANPAAELLFGYSQEELRKIGRQGILDHSEESGMRELLTKRETDGRASGEVTGIRKNGEHFPLEFSSAIFKDKNNEAYTHTILNDITEKKAVQQKVAANEKRFRAMVENGADAIVIVDATVNPIYISPGVNRIVGYTEQESLQLDSFNTIHPDDGDYIRTKIQESLSKPGIPIKNLSYRIKHKDGRWLFIEATITNLLHEPSIGGIVTNFSDVTQRKQIETQLSSLTDNLNGVVFRYKINPDGTDQLLYLSKGSIDIWGIKAEDAMNDIQLVWSLFFEEDLPAVIQTIQQSAATLDAWTAEWRIHHPDGTTRWQRGNGNPQRFSDGTIVWDSLIIDISAQKELEREKMEAAGKLAERNVFIETILEKLPIGISVNKIDTGEATMINNNFSKIYGWEDKDLTDVASFFEKVYPDETYRKEMIERVMSDIESRVPERMAWKGIEVTDQNGQKKTINAKNIPLYEQNLMISTVTDVSTEARQAAEIQRTKTELDKIMEYSPDVVCTINEQGEFVKLSAATEAIWGYTPEELVGKKFNDFVHPDDQEKSDLAAADVILGRGLTNFENRYIRKDGSEVPTIWSAKWDEKEKLMFCIAKDGTEKNIAETALVESEKKYKNLFENNPSPMFIWEFTSKQIIDCNTEALRQYGYSREEFLQLSINDIRPKEDIAKLEKATANEEIYGSIHTKIWRHLRKNGELFFVEVNGHLINYNGVKASLVMVTDITEKLIAEEEIRESNLRYENVTKATSDAIWDWNLETNELYWGMGFQTLFGHTIEHQTSNFESWRNHVHPDDLEAVLESLQDGIDNSNTDNWQKEYRYRKADGSFAFVIDKGIIIRGVHGKAIHMYGAMQDITKQKQEEQRLKLMSSVVTSTNDAVLITEAEPFDEPGPRIIYANDAFINMTGYTREEVIGKTPRILQGPKSDRAELKRLGEALRNWEPCEITTINYKKNGEEFWVNFAVSPVADEKGFFTHWISIQRDVTQQKNAEIQKTLLNKITGIFNDPDSLVTILEKVLQQITAFGGFTFADAWLVAADGKTINRIAGFAETEAMQLFLSESANIKSIKKGEGIAGIAWETKTIQRWNDVDKRKDFLRHKAAKTAGLKTAIALPLYHNFEVIGVLTIGLEDNKNSLINFEALLGDLGNYMGAEIKRKQLEQELHQLFSFAPDIIAIAGMDGYFKKINPATVQLLEYSETELLSTPFVDFVHPDDKHKTGNELKSLIGGNPTFYFENRYITKSGKLKWLAWTATPSPQEAAVFAVAKDITERKELEDLLQRANQMARIGGWEVDLLKGTLIWSAITKEIHEVAADFVPQMDTAINFYKDGEHRDKISRLLQTAMENGQPWDEELQIVTAKGNERWIRAIGGVEIVNGKCIRIFGSFQDIDERKKSALAVTETLEEKNNILESIGDAFFAVDKNWTVTYWNQVAEKVLGMSRENIVGKHLWDLYEDAIDTDFYKFYHLAVKENKVQQFEARYDTLNLWIEVSAYPSPNGLSVYFKDITQRKESELKLKELNEDLQKQTKQLEVSNRELEQFAFVASHDLQEPLRMVSSFLGQLNRKYEHSLDENAKKYIHFAVDGAARMRAIILDLLEFSRIGRTEENYQMVDLNKLVEDITVMYSKQIEETKAIINTGKLPTLHLFTTPLRQVFQNLISNALKYSKTDITPIINIQVVDNKTHWLFSVSDNGIGISAEYYDKIFVIFQRLHNKDKYSGTGMGLAVTKKIIESFNGKIWLESDEDKGSTFYFTIPKNEII